MTEQYLPKGINVQVDPDDTGINVSGALIQKGMVLANDSSTVVAGVTPSVVPFDPNLAGIALEDVPDGGAVPLKNQGQFEVLVTGAVTANDPLETSGVAGVAVVAGSFFDGTFAVALEDNADPGIKLVRARHIFAEVF